MNSRSWCTNYKSIANLFLTPGWIKDSHDMDLKDLSTVLSLWDNCSEYDISPNLIKKLRELRNGYFAHNPSMEVSDSKITSVFNVLGVLFHETDVKSFITPDKCKQELDTIKMKNEIDMNMIRTFVKQFQNETKDENLAMRQSVTKLEKEIHNIKAKSRMRFCRNNIKTGVFATSCIIICVLLLICWSKTSMWPFHKEIKKNNIVQPPNLNKGRCTITSLNTSFTLTFRKFLRRQNKALCQIFV